MESAAARAVATVVSCMFGLFIGSFLNVVVYRLPRRESIVHPPSHCPTCGTQLGALENIPILSWLALRGRCRHCAAAISPRYPLVELATGALFAGTALASSTAAPLASIDAVLAVTLAIGAIDLDRELVPPILPWLALGASATLVVVSLAQHHPGRLVGAAVGAAVTATAWAASMVGGRNRGEAHRFPPLPACVAWGWTAGWTGAAGGFVVGIALILLVLVATARPSALRRGTASGALVAIAAIVAGIAVGS